MGVGKLGDMEIEGLKSEENRREVLHCSDGTHGKDLSLMDGQGA